MQSIALVMFLVGFLGGNDIPSDHRPKDDPSKKEALLLVDTIESLQQSLEDFRCEFEGTIRCNRIHFKIHKLEFANDGLFETYNGVFIWRRGGDIYMDIFRRKVPYNNKIERETVVIRMSERKAEQYRSFSDGAILGGSVGDPGLLLARRAFPLFLFSTAYLKYVVPSDCSKYYFEDGEIDGQRLRIINGEIGENPGSLFKRYWIDLRQSGQVRRREDFYSHFDSSGRPVRSVQQNFRLAPFKVGGDDIWMPVSGENEWYLIADPDNNGKLLNLVDDPWHREEIRVVGGTMEINKHPGPEVFTIKYKPGTPISDNLRKLQYEYGQQTMRAKPTKAEVETMLKEQLAKAEEQKSELVVASTPEGVAWSRWLTAGFGVAVVISSIARWLQRRGH